MCVSHNRNVFAAKKSLSSTNTVMFYKKQTKKHRSVNLKKAKKKYPHAHKVDRVVCINSPLNVSGSDFNQQCRPI